jgi:hypothetical protein
LQLDQVAAARRLAELEKARASFYHRYWPTQSLCPERFTLTLNTAEIDDQSMVECVTPLVRRPRATTPNPTLKGASNASP